MRYPCLWVSKFVSFEIEIGFITGRNLEGRECGILVGETGTEPESEKETLQDYKGTTGY
jgi:hypothetical protein